MLRIRRCWGTWMYWKGDTYGYIMPYETDIRNPEWAGSVIVRSNGASVVCLCDADLVVDVVSVSILHGCSVCLPW